jgi:hypothetical protein
MRLEIEECIKLIEFLQTNALFPEINHAASIQKGVFLRLHIIDLSLYN